MKYKTESFIDENDLKVCSRGRFLAEMFAVRLHVIYFEFAAQIIATRFQRVKM